MAEGVLHFQERVPVGDALRLWRALEQLGIAGGFAVEAGLEEGEPEEGVEPVQ